MRTIQISIVIFLLLFVAGCKPPTPQPQPTPTSIQAPVATPTPPPTSMPRARLAPAGTLYVVKAFSVKSESGVYGFSVGKKVTLIADRAGSYSVSDGETEATASKDSFTNDLDVLDALLKDEAAKHSKRQQTNAAQQIHSAERQDQQASQFEADKIKRAEAEKTSRLNGLKAQLAEVNSRISQARSERIQKGFPPDGGARHNNGSYDSYYGQSRRFTTTATLSADAAQIEQLMISRDQIQSQLKLQQ